VRAKAPYGSQFWRGMRGQRRTLVALSGEF